ncbi:hypothetical protein CVT24_006602 [Panaeolus cyanescens]|uniref:Uncharacterized protein n=1 Tax=Panaeolus cyanescens TaxID=181874 RepID=A0A409WP40_9AGAR|nr:hypothetical protein CVT24_006602 [Panaeolus cyanescens]
MDASPPPPPPTLAQPPPSTQSSLHGDGENVAPSPTPPRRSSHKRGKKFLGLGSSFRASESKRKAEDDEKAAASQRPKKVPKNFSQQLERPAYLPTGYSLAPGSLYDLLLRSEENAMAREAMEQQGSSSENSSSNASPPSFAATIDLPPLSPILDSSTSTIPDTSERKVPQPPPVFLPAPSVVTRRTPRYPYEYTRPPRLYPRNAPLSLSKLIIHWDTRPNPFRPHYTKINGERVRFLSDSSEVETPTPFVTSCVASSIVQ